MKIKKDWWLVNSIFYIIDGLLVIFLKANAGLLQAGLFIGGVQLLIGIALLQRSKIAFWLVLIVSAYGFLSGIGILLKQPGNYISLLINGVTLALALMLWQQIKKDKKKK